MRDDGRRRRTERAARIREAEARLKENPLAAYLCRVILLRDAAERGRGGDGLHAALADAESGLRLAEANLAAGLPREAGLRPEQVPAVIRIRRRNQHPFTL